MKTLRIMKCYSCQHNTIHKLDSIITATVNGSDYSVGKYVCIKCGQLKARTVKHG